MINKHAVLLALLIPGLAVLAGCNDRDGDDVVAPVATTTPAEPMPAEPMPGQDMAAMGNEMSFANMDKNSDGGITHDEMMDTEMLHQHFSVADANSDGKLSEDEVMKHRADMAAAPAK
ncbi:MAG: hypothetical protein M3R16_11670 [Pseudomonadota bacterium]|nr:hypothetical protein [Pseudomonadota bacterium]